MPALTMLKGVKVTNKLTLYLSTGPKCILDVLAWWYEKRTVYPMLAHMALDYLSIPATSVDIKHVLSCD